MYKSLWKKPLRYIISILADKYVSPIRIVIAFESEKEFISYLFYVYAPNGSSDSWMEYEIHRVMMNFKNFYLLLRAPLGRIR